MLPRINDNNPPSQPSDQDPSQSSAQPLAQPLAENTPSSVPTALTSSSAVSSSSSSSSSSTALANLRFLASSSSSSSSNHSKSEQKQESMDAEEFRKSLDAFLIDVFAQKFSSILFQPIDSVVGGFTSLLGQYHQIWSESGREIVKESLETFLTELHEWYHSGLEAPNSCGDVANDVVQIVLGEQANQLKYVDKIQQEFSDYKGEKSGEALIAEIKQICQSGEHTQTPALIRMEVFREEDNKWKGTHSFVLYVIPEKDGVVVYQSYYTVYTLEDWMNSDKFKNTMPMPLTEYLDSLNKIVTLPKGKKREQAYNTLFGMEPNSLSADSDAYVVKYRVLALDVAQASHEIGQRKIHLAQQLQGLASAIGKVSSETKDASSTLPPSIDDLRRYVLFKGLEQLGINKDAHPMIEKICQLSEGDFKKLFKSRKHDGTLEKAAEILEKIQEEIQASSTKRPRTTRGHN